MKTRSTAETTSRSLLRFFLTCMTLNAATLTAVEVSVCRDATYELAVDAASLCAGAGAEPAGRHCPKAGDVAVDDCLSTLPSFTNGRCVLPEDAVCQVVNDQETWGCVLPSVGCNHTEIQSEETGRCETWDLVAIHLRTASSCWRIMRETGTRAGSRRRRSCGSSITAEIDLPLHLRGELTGGRLTNRRRTRGTRRRRCLAQGTLTKKNKRRRWRCR